MKKNLLTILLAGLLLLSVAACKKDPDDTEETKDIDTAETTGSYLVVGTDTDEDATDDEPGDDTEPGTDAFDPSEEDPTFTDADKKIVIVSYAATIRSSTQVKEDNAVAWPSEGRELTVTGESEHWYRITYPVNGTDTTCYVAKSVAADTALLATFTTIEGGEEVEVIADSFVNYRSYPSADYDSAKRGTLAKGTKVTRLATNENWSLIELEVESETETNEDGSKKVELKKYYVNSKYLQVVKTEETTTTAE